MSARSKGSGLDDLNLSLTGSHISSVIGSRRQVTTPKQLKRPNSMTDVSSRDAKAEKNKPGQSLKKQTEGSEPFSFRSNSSDVSSVSQASKKKAKQPGDDFLALFESTVQQPKIKSAPSKGKKPSANAVKVLWNDPKLQNRIFPNSKQKASNSSPFEAAETWTTEEPLHHSIFQQKSARSSSDEDEFQFRDRLSQSHSGSQKFPVPSDKEEKRIGDHLDLDLLNSERSNHGNTARTSNMTSMNNMTTQGMSPSVKIGFSSLENSFKNIKHKEPVNQTRETSSNSNQTSKYLAEDYIRTIENAAVKIQRWYRRHHNRRKTSGAAIKRMLENKKRTLDEQKLRESQNDVFQSISEGKKMEERKRIREEKARQARQEAVRELQRKREEKKTEIKKKAEEEIAFLQATGKITKNPAQSGKKKAGMGKMNGRKPPSPLHDDDNDSTPRQGQSKSQDNSMEDFLESASNVQQVDTSPESARKDDQSEKNTLVASEAVTKTTVDDLLETLKKLEEEEHLDTVRKEKKNSWIDDIDKDNAVLSAENLEKLNASKDHLNSYRLLSDDKLKSIMSFLDEVQVADRLSTVDQEISKLNEDLERPALLVPSADELAELEDAQKAASEVTSKVLSQRLELDEKKRTVQMLQKALNQQRELTIRHAREIEREMKKRLDVQKDEYEDTIKRHLGFIDQLIDDKKNMSEKCENLVKELKTVDKKYQDKIKAMEDKHGMELQKLKDMHEAAEKLRREKWIEDKTKKIKEMTVKGLEPEIQRLIAKHKSEIKKIKQIHEAELLESDERAAQRYVKMTEELREQLAQEKEAAITREREMAKKRYEKQLQQEEEGYQQQRRRLYSEVQEEKERIAQAASRQRAELDKLQQQLEDSHSHALEAMKVEFEKARNEQERRHETEIRELKEKLAIEKQSWEENYMKRHDNWLMQKERELREQVKKDRDKEIEMVITRLEEESTAAREDCEKVAENRIKRIREKFESEAKELERSERQALEKYNEMKAQLTEVEGENECLKVFSKQKDQEIEKLQELTDKMHRERDRVSDIIRQEFADRLVATDEENKRIKNEISELKARHRIEVNRAKEEMEEVKRNKDNEMEEVHKRVKQAIVKKEEVVNQLKQQYQAALKRADHLEGLLQQQRKQLLGK
ncbi:hypothetical protein CHS0354_028100 [Potamilus streckersoni]|uniref:5-azacytidine-induced protein 1 n=1 Tax=Potamilus streckersoni TaxID=2493646 RepID=A0AAE0WES1_9BIVA|nr:hypothetical protein CHS0354_028100 [Potamilus streckersoni]